MTDASKNVFFRFFTRETASVLTTDIGVKTVSVLAHSPLLPQRANSRNGLSIHSLKYTRNKL